MAYCTLEDIKKKIRESELIQLTDDRQSGQIDEPIVVDAIVSASSEIDGYCGFHYTVPFADNAVPMIIKSLCQDMTVYHLFCRAQGAPEDWQKRYDNAIKLLGEMAKGTVTLNVPRPEEKQHDKVLFDAPEKVFTRDRLRNF